jgi:hypothetical protein
MTLAALITWFAAVVAGLCLLAIWLIEYDKSDVDSHLPRTMVSAHGMLAVVGLVVWSAYADGGTSRLAWTAAAILAVVAVLGLTMAGRWIGVYRMYKTPSAVVVRIGAPRRGRRGRRPAGTEIPGAARRRARRPRRRHDRHRAAHGVHPR